MSRSGDPYANLPEIANDVEVLGLTDRDPEFFEKQAARKAGTVADPNEILGRGMPAGALDRMLRRPRRRKGATR